MNIVSISFFLFILLSTPTIAEEQSLINPRLINKPAIVELSKRIIQEKNIGVNLDGLKLLDITYEYIENFKENIRITFILIGTEEIVKSDDISEDLLKKILPEPINNKKEKEFKKYKTIIINIIQNKDKLKNEITFGETGLQRKCNSLVVSDMEKNSNISRRISIQSSL